MAQVRVLALDFVGTLAGHGPAPDGRLVADVLRTLPGATVPDSFPSRFDSVTRRFRLTDQARGVRTSFATRLRRAAHDCGASVPDLRLAVEAVFTAVPDARVDPRAAQALRALCANGLSCVLASNTDRPRSVRLQTLRAAGIADCFGALVLSSTLGLRKPDPRFYAAVTRAAGCPPEDILFVGDNPENDAVAPHAFGMSAVLITSRPRPATLPAAIATLGHVSELTTHVTLRCPHSTQRGAS
ncbi:HAD family hydrolase [Streptomyces sp. NPDC006632]|uniref:HAD family hydrolase n=1 Tax=unclassified Streptomyces TaxID=2593676 RepID=UPI002E24BE2A